MSRPTDARVARRRFSFRAVAESGAVATGELWATSEAFARDQLAQRRLLPIDLRTHDDEVRRRPSDLELAVGLRVIGSLLDARLPLARVLAAFAAVAPGGWTREAIATLDGEVREGRSLSAALGATFPTAPQHLVSMIAAGEAAGSAAESCRVAATELEVVANGAKAVRAALAYPLILALTGAVAITVLVGVVLPRFAILLEDVGQTLPWSTRAVLAAGTVLKGALLPIFALTLCVAVLLTWWRRSDDRATRSFDGGLLRIPIAGPLFIAASGARVAGTLGSLLHAGVALPAALPQAAAASGNTEISARLLDATARVEAGERLSRAFELTRALPLSLTQLVRAGEEAGDLPMMLAFGARLERERLQDRVTALVRLLEPAMILGFGGAVALVAAALLQAIYAVRPA